MPDVGIEDRGPQVAQAGVGGDQDDVARLILVADGGRSGQSVGLSHPLLTRKASPVALAPGGFRTPGANATGLADFPRPASPIIEPRTSESHLHPLQSPTPGRSAPRRIPL